MRHLLSEKDFEARTAVCSICGPVRLKKKGPAWRCMEGWRVQKHRDLIKSRYGINWREWDALLVAQSGRCAICNDPMEAPRVDHCHRGNGVRGLLCHGCNVGLGWFRDDPTTLRQAADYLDG